MAGKLASWGVIGAIHPGNLVHVKDDISGASFLVDTGSSLSIKFRRPPVFLVLSFGSGGIPHPGCVFSSKISTAGGLSCSPLAHLFTFILFTFILFTSILFTFTLFTFILFTYTCKGGCRGCFPDIRWPRQGAFQAVRS